MGCGCGGNRNKAAATRVAATPPPAVLWEVMRTAGGQPVHRTRDRPVARSKAKALYAQDPAAHYRQGGTTTPIRDWD